MNIIPTNPEIAFHLHKAVELYMRDYNPEEAPPPDYMDVFIKQAMQLMTSKMLEVHRGNQSQAAKALGINRGTLRKRITQDQRRHRQMMREAGLS